MTRAVALRPVLAAPLSWYAAMASSDLAIIDGDRPFDKRDKGTHRFAIADVRGSLNITVPISHGSDNAVRVSSEHHSGRPGWNDILVSDHNRWWLTAASTMETAYGGTPWFHDLWPRFRHLFSDDAVGRSVLAYMLDMDAVIRDTTGIATRVSVGAPSGCVPPIADFDPAQYAVPAYRQVRQERLGFVPGLSILDALFNIGPDDTLALLQGK